MITTGSTTARADVSGGTILSSLNRRNTGPATFNIAVTPPEFDDVGEILTRLGYTWTEIQDSDLNDYNNISQYDIVFANCSGTALDNGPNAASALQQFVQNGGSLYASDWAYRYVDSAFPEHIAFPAEPHLGDAQIVAADIVDSGLANYLDSTNPPSTIDLNYDLGGWVVINSVAPGTHVFLRGSFSTTTPSTSNMLSLESRDPLSHQPFNATPQDQMTDKPLAASFRPYGNSGGKVIYTTFHNEAQRSEIEERLLEYFVLVPSTGELTAQAASIVSANGGDVEQESVDTINQGETTGLLSHVVSALKKLLFVANWGGSTLRMSVYQPDGSLYEETESSSPPLSVVIPEAEPGEWSYEVTGVDIPYENYPYVALVGEESYSWQSFPSPTTDSLEDLEMVTSTEGWAVGGTINDHGTILHYDGASWILATDTISDTLEAVSMLSDTEGWAVGRNGTIVYYDGTSWNPVTSPTTNWLTSIDMLSSAEGWATSFNELLYYDGSSWTVHTTLGDTVSLLDIDMVSSTDGWAVGWDGSIYHYDGASWTPFTSPTNDRFISVHMLSATDGWIVGENDSVILHYDGSAWATVSNPAVGGIYGVDFGSPGWAVGEDGVILSYDGTNDGTNWAVEHSPTTIWLTAVDMVSETNGWAVGSEGSILHYSPTGTHNPNVQLDYLSRAINWDSTNQNGVANPDEWVYFSVTVRNTGSVDAINVRGELYNGDAYVDTFGEDGTGEFGTIPGNGGAGTSDFYLHTQWFTPHQHQIPLKLKLLDDSGNAWMIPFTIEVLDTIGPDISDEQANPKTLSPGDEVVISAQTQDGSGVDSVFVDIYNPSETISTTLQLFDDGSHSDGAADDDTYANRWTTETTPQDYLVDIIATDGLGNTSNSWVGFSTKSFVKTSDILLVMDQWSPTGVTNYYTDALTAIGHDYDLWDTFFRGWSLASVLNQYTNTAIIWAAPGWSGLWDTNVQSALQSFLNEGGNLFITGQDVGWVLTEGGDEGNTLYNDHLHADYVQDDIDLYALNGMVGDPIGDGLSFSISGGAGADNQSWPSEIDPIAPAEPVFVYDSGSAPSSQFLKKSPVSVAQEREARKRSHSPQKTEGHMALADPHLLAKPALLRRPSPESSRVPTEPQDAISSGTGALRVDTDTYKVVYFAFGFEAINGIEPRYRVMKRVLEWLRVYPEACPDFVDPVGVDVRDVMVVVNLWDQASAWPYDCDGDDIITSADIMCVVERWRETCPILPLFFDDFESLDGEWFTDDASDIRWSYQAGEYEILLRNADWWGGVTAPIGGLTNYSIEADIRRHTGSASFYGLIFDHVDWDHFYYFIVNPDDQTYSIWRHDPDWAAVVDWTSSSHINLSDATNHLKVERDGSQITIYANGELLTTTNDDTYTGSFQVGLYADNPADGSVPAAVRFDDFQVTLLENSAVANKISTSDLGTSASRGASTTGNR